MTQSSENGTGACLVFLVGFWGKNVLSRGQGLKDCSGLVGGWPWHPCFFYNEGQAQGAPWTALSLCHAPPLATRGPPILAWGVSRVQVAPAAQYGSGW